MTELKKQVVTLENTRNALEDNGREVTRKRVNFTNTKEFCESKPNFQHYVNDAEKAYRDTLHEQVMLGKKLRVTKENIKVEIAIDLDAFCDAYIDC